MITHVPAEEWAEWLAGFTERNAGRRTSIEVDESEVGAQRQETGYSLQGVAFDRRDNRVEIMVGSFEGAGAHLARAIGGVRSIDVLEDEHGREIVLRIAYESGQTLLRIEPSVRANGG